MSVQEFYAVIGSDYEMVKGHLVTDDRIKRFVNMFFMDESYDNLLNAFEENDLETAFRCAHTLKGNARNVGFNALAESASDLTESLRPDDKGNPVAPEKAPNLLNRVKQDMELMFAAKDLISL